MIHRPCVRGCSVACCFLVMGLSNLCRADESDELAKQFLAKAGIRVGVCEMPRVGDGALAAALARQGIALVMPWRPTPRRRKRRGNRPPTAACSARR